MPSAATVATRAIVSTSLSAASPTTKGPSPEPSNSLVISLPRLPDATPGSPGRKANSGTPDDKDGSGVYHQGTKNIKGTNNMAFDCDYQMFINLIAVPGALGVLGGEGRSVDSLQFDSWRVAP
jgi:hypothetical protein